MTIGRYGRLAGGLAFAGVIAYLALLRARPGYGNAPINVNSTADVTQAMTDAS